VKYGNLGFLKWAKENHYTFTPLTSLYAAENGHLDILKWLKENNCEFDSIITIYAAKNGHLEILKWLKENNVSFNETTCEYAAKNSNIEIIKWLRKNGCPWNWNTCINAIKCGHVHIYNWARVNGCSHENNDTSVIKQKSIIFSESEYNNFKIPIASNCKKIVMAKIIKNIVSEIDNAVNSLGTSYIKYDLVDGQEKYYEEIKEILEYYEHEVSITELIIEIKW
jgi:hypothetical protein